eukprot:g1958.t1
MQSEDESAWLKDDGKRLPGSRGIRIIYEVFFSCVLILLIFCLIPFFVCGLVISTIKKLFSKKSNPKIVSIDIIDKTKGPPRSKREFDLILYGATGFTGRIAAQYIANRKEGKNKLKWAIAGRNERALERVVTDLGLGDVPIVIADSTKQATIDVMCRKTKCLISTVGPFDLYGRGVVAACAYAGTHYCDITGESDFVRSMIDHYDDVARESGARIVSFCGHDCVPWDLVVLKAAEHMKEVSLKATGKPESIQVVHCFDEIRGSASGGTIATVFHALWNHSRSKSKLGFDPLLKTLDGKKSANIVQNNNRIIPGYDSMHRGGSYVGNFVMSGVMANCIKRSNALNSYSSNIVYRESLVFSGCLRLFRDTMMMLIFGLSLYITPVLLLIKSFLPKPGQGPSTDAMDKGFLQVSCYAQGDQGGACKTTIYFPTGRFPQNFQAFHDSFSAVQGAEKFCSFSLFSSFSSSINFPLKKIKPDAGYRETARMLVESGLCLAIDDEFKKIKSDKGGIFTPASCLGDVLLDRLMNSGTKFRVRTL